MPKNKLLCEAMKFNIIDCNTGTISNISALDVEKYTYKEDQYDVFIIYIITKNKEEKYVYDHRYQSALKYDSEKDAISFCNDMEKVSNAYKKRISQYGIRKRIRTLILKFNPKNREEFKVKTNEIRTYQSFLKHEVKSSYFMMIRSSKLLDKKIKLYLQNEGVVK